MVKINLVKNTFLLLTSVHFRNFLTLTLAKGVKSVFIVGSGTLALANIG